MELTEVLLILMVTMVLVITMAVFMVVISVGRQNNSLRQEVERIEQRKAALHLNEKKDVTEERNAE